MDLRSWQAEALRRWKANGNRGIVAVVTGGGKTVFALACIREIKPDTTIIVVPTQALLDQWWEEASSYFNVPLDDINILDSKGEIRPGTINLVVLNTAAKIAKRKGLPKCMLVVDECHKAASEKFREALDIPNEACLGLSATPERQYDDGLQEVLIPKLGSIIYEYGYKEALTEGVIVNFTLRNVIFTLEEDRQTEYDKLSKSIASAISQNGVESPIVVALMLKRARVLNLSLERIRIALRIVAANSGLRVLLFHEDINACDLIFMALADNRIPCGVYHSRQSLRERAATLSAYRRGQINVLVTCRALDEGFNVPETQIGIIVASTATRRQRIQRLGRVLRPAPGKVAAEIFTLVATDPEIARLREEEIDLEGAVDVTWSQA